MRPSPLRSKSTASAKSAGKTEMMPRTPRTTPTTGRNAVGRKPATQCVKRMKIWSTVSAERSCRTWIRLLRRRVGCFSRRPLFRPPPSRPRPWLLQRPSPRPLPQPLWPWLPPRRALRPGAHPPRPLPWDESGGSTRSTWPACLRSSSSPPKRSSVASSNSVSILMASNGQTSTQIWQLMQTEISISKRAG